MNLNIIYNYNTLIKKKKKTHYVPEIQKKEKEGIFFLLEKEGI